MIGPASSGGEPGPGLAAAALAPALHAVDVSRAFGGVQALAKASFEASFGEVHALVGENGAGKSTMIKILSGVLRPDAGTITIRGRQLDLVTPQDAKALRIATVFQELTLMPWMTVADNLLLDDPPRGVAGLIRRRRLGERADEVLTRYGATGIDPLELAANLSVAQRQVLEIVRALRRDPQILFLDEPTAALSGREVEWLFRLVRDARERGCCIIFTSHRWREVEDIANRITVYRNGADVATRNQLTEDEAVTLMTGRAIDRVYPAPPPLAANGAAALEVRGLHGSGLRGVSLSVHPGEILGIGGLAGQGQRQLFLSLFGATRSTGEIHVGGRPRRIRRPKDAIRAGLALVPEDRKNEGLLLPLSARDNLTLSILGQVSRAGLIDRRAERAQVERMVDRLRIRTTSGAAQPAGTLSGGNQQKLLLGRWLLTRANVLLMYDVTRGVDAATKHDLYQLITALAAEGKAVLLYSSETEEMAHLCHRVLVMREGQVSAELTGPVDAEAIVAASLREHAGV
jgi:ribose transport system ATP-binding protein